MLMENERILLTGASGYLGRLVLPKLIARNVAVHLLQRKHSSKHLLPSHDDKIKVYLFDGVNLPSDLLEESFTRIIHLACSYGKNETISSVYTCNTILPLQLLEHFAPLGLKQFLNADTVLPAGTGPYASSKKEFLKWAEPLAQKYHVLFSNLLIEQFIGKGMSRDFFPIHLLCSCLEEKKEIPMTEGGQKRDFIYVEDVVSAILCVLDNAKESAHYPVGLGTAVSLKEFALKIKEKTQSSSRLGFSALPYRNCELMYSSADTAALKKLSWRPRYELDEALDICIHHYKKEIAQ